MIVNGWTLLFHEAIVGQLERLSGACQRARKADPKGFHANANVRLFAALAKLILEVIPSDPGRPEYRQGNTLGPAYRHWFRVKFHGRFRLFFRYDSRSRIIVFAWVNDQSTLRQRGSKSDPYEVFGRMLASGNPPNDWAALVRSSGALPKQMMSAGDASERGEQAAGPGKTSR
jgi:toxin YhaV